ncbi:Xaa-Pro peptidase family protein [Agrobacterium sp. rho-13.3]|uniref:Xaa-Pro peptidase family protein n=1 Tax=Agrobacterium sp. rho-13.3 TaxID=3072980 RepID=UPI002A12C845|nr:Xaa-Pro peptidase family protein [Agrobacterium sp. rho-13.3]MDX8309097.1 Xaa-Pro peptidase family protein [Agrobacterium sp. rho-13.3]
MSDIDRTRAQRLMLEAGLDALVLFQPEAFRYAIGAPAGVATMWGRAGAAIAVVPADAESGLAAIASDHAASTIRKLAPSVNLRTHRIWIDMLDITGADTVEQINATYDRHDMAGPRPETFDRSTAFGLLGEVLTERGLHRARVGVDLEFMPAADFEALKTALPDVTWVDGSLVLRRLRAVKTPREIERLRRATNAAEAGLVQLAAAVKPGASLPELSAAWQAGAQAYAATNGFSMSSHWDFISVGADLSNMNAVATRGALIKADVGTLVDGYSSDSARTFTHGPALPLAQDVFKALEHAFAAGLEQIRPGNTFGAVHRATLGSMRRDGFLQYYRGHFGHSVGGSVGIEEWPFFSTSNPERIEENMVLALETPFYGNGLGALMIEDQFLVGAGGVECLNRLPRGLIDLETAG